MTTTPARAPAPTPTGARPKLLVVDDGDRYVELAHAFLRDYDYATRCAEPGPCWSCPRRPGCTLTHAHDLAETVEALGRHRDVDVLLLDVAFELPAARLAPSPTGERSLARRRRLQGLDILAAVRRTHPSLPVILMTSREELADDAALAAVDALAADESVVLAGADAFDARALSLLVERVLAYRGAPAADAGYLWGGGAAMARLRRDALTLARTSLPMLLLGETGTGKSALAERVIHPASGRRGPFVSVDLAALPSTLVAAELFGAARGAFSGAVERPGRFEAADGGTLFLDEIGNLPPDVQRTLLVALEERRVTRLGESTARPVDVKLVAATNADLPALVRAGTFRADLYARLNPAARLVLPPLRERRADLDQLIAGFVARAFAGGADRRLLLEYAEAARLDHPVAAVALGRPPSSPSPRAITFIFAAASMSALRRHDWPGNLRELNQLVVNATVFALADAMEAARRGGHGVGAAARMIPIPATLVRRLLGRDGDGDGERAGDGGGGGGSGSGSGSARAVGRSAGTQRGRVSLALTPRASLHAVARDLERQLYEQLFTETGGDFAAMAARLVGSHGPKAARRVRLRFNQLGLRARKSTNRRI
jgi:DNA-binding NtrC family response regulator